MPTLAYVLAIILGLIVLIPFSFILYDTIRRDIEEKKAQKLKESING